MAFPEPIKLSVRRKSHFQCCLCKSLGVEVHHIIPHSEGGPDTEDNAAPLCPSCHEIYGANPAKRKMITEARDVWYEICSARYAPDIDRVERPIGLLEGTTATITGFQEFVNRLTRQPSETEDTEPKRNIVRLPVIGQIGDDKWVRIQDCPINNEHESGVEEDLDEDYFEQEPRTEIELLEALDKLFDQIWYNRHWGHRIDIEEGRDTADPEIWKQALAAAARVEEKYRDDPEALGPWSDFEWGMLNGKMSALRWVLGDEWDFLDT